MKKILAMGLILAMCLCGCGETVTDDLEKFTWGMTRDEVIAEKGSQPDETSTEERELIYKGEKRYGLPCDVSYWITPDEGLFSVYYIYSKNYEDVNDYKSDFEKVSQQLRSELGEPRLTWDSSDEERVSSDTDGLMDGVILYENWHLGETSINHSVTDFESRGLTHSVYYMAP